MKRKGKEQEEPMERAVAFDPVRGGYLDIDTAGWAKKARLKERGTDEGRSKSPAAEQGTQDEAHHEIRGWIETRAQQCRQEVEQYLGDMTNAATSAFDESGLAQLQAHAITQAKSAKGRYDKQVAQDVTELTPSLREMRQQRNGMDAFREAHEIGQRQADYDNYRKAWLWIFAIGVVEMVLNAIMLGEVMPYGFAGAISLVAFITLFNLGLGFIFGSELWRMRNHVEGTVRTGGTIGIIVLTLIIIGGNVLVGQFRDLMESVGEAMRAGTIGQAEAFGLTWEQAMEAPLSFDSFQAVLVTVIGVVCYAIAVWKGFGRDDEYPGYGKITRKLKRVEARYQDLYEEKTQRLEALHKEALDTLDDIGHEASSKRDQHREVCEAGRKFAAQFPDAMRAHQNALATLTSIYRDANRKARGGTPVPDWFNEEPRLAAEMFDPPAFTPPDRPDVGVLSGTIAEQKQMLEAYYGKLLAEHYPVG